ncbi:MAG: hypothetical protein VXY73_07465 [Pseudomonadota bacterium]|jgi:hypothetical protein|nr:hypothetical protein [Pseudomonadota bacterium]
MSELEIAVDEAQAALLVARGQSMLGNQSRSGTSSLGPFDANWSASASITGGSVDLRAPDIIRLANVNFNFSLGLGLSFDLSDILPDFCIPQVCIPIPFLPDLCTPEVCINWPTITLPTINHSGMVTFTSDFRLNATADGSDWVADIEIVDIPNLQLDAISTAIVAAIMGAVALALSTIPFIGPFLALATAAIGAIFAVSAITGWLGPILSLFLSGLTFELYRAPQVQTVIPAGGAFDPAVQIRITSLGASVVSSDEDELLLAADIAPV